MMDKSKTKQTDAHEKDNLKKITSNKKRIIKVSVVIVVLLLFVVGITYAFFTSSLFGNKVTSIKVGGLTFKYQENTESISLSNVKPLSDEEGKTSNNYFDFEVSLDTKKQDSIGYSIYLTKDSISTLEESAVKLYLTDQDDKKIINPLLISNLDNFNPIPNSKVIYEASISANNEKVIQKYRLRVWIDESYNSNNITVEGNTQSYSSEAKSYKFKVGVSNLDKNGELISRKITINNQAGGSINGPSSARIGEEVTLEVTPDVGYALESLKYNDIDITETRSFIMPNSDVVISVTWKKNEYAITINQTTGGTLSSEATGVVGDSITFTTTTTTSTCAEYAYNGAAITNSTTGETYLTLDANTQSFAMPNYAITITPNWQMTKEYLFNNGTVCSLAGSFIYRNTSEASVTNNGQALIINSSYTHDAYAITSKTINLANYSRVGLKMGHMAGANLIKTYTANTGIWDGQGANLFYANTAGTTEKEMDLTVTTGSYYIAFRRYGNNQAGSANLYYLYLVPKK